MPASYVVDAKAIAHGYLPGFARSCFATPSSRLLGSKALLRASVFGVDERAAAFAARVSFRSAVFTTTART